MKLFKSLIVVVLSTMFILPAANAAEVEVTWTEPEKYRDVKPNRNEGRKNFRERVMKSLDEHFIKMAENLDNNQKLLIEVTDVDLAGDIHGGGMNQIRIVKHHYHPRIEFSYKLVNADGSILVDEQINLKDMNFMSGSSLRYKNDFLGYEKKMLDDWFKKAFAEHIVESSKDK